VGLCDTWLGDHVCGHHWMLRWLDLERALLRACVEDSAVFEPAWSCNSRAVYLHRFW